MSLIFYYARQLGPLRVILVITTLLLAVLTPFAQVNAEPVGWGLLFGVLIPALGPIVFMVICLDLLVCQMWKGEVEPEHNQRLVLAQRVNLVLLLVMFAAWWPVLDYLLSLTD